MAIQRINVLDYRGLGKKFIQWALDHDSRPATLADFLTQTRGIIDSDDVGESTGKFPGYIKSVMFVQAHKETLLIRLPPAEIVQDTLDAIAAGGQYRLPSFYEETFVHGQHQDKREFFEFRIGDYLIAHCA